MQHPKSGEDAEKQTAGFEEYMSSCAVSEKSFEQCHDSQVALSADSAAVIRPKNDESPLARVISNRTTKSTRSNVITRISSRLTSTHVDDSPPPDGGVTAWTQCFLTWLVMINTWGFVFAFAPFQTYYTSALNLPQSTVSWIGSTQAFLMFFVGAFSGRALDAGLMRPVILLGIVLQVLGIFMMSLSTKYWQLFLTHGVMTGLGGGLFFCPSMALLNTYFVKRRGIAVGIATTGNSIGGIVFPLIVRQLLPKVGFGWTARVLGFVSLASLSLVLALSKPRLQPRKAGPIIEWRAIYDIPYVLFVIGVCFNMAGVYFVYYYISSFARNIIHLPYTSSLNLAILINGVAVPTRILPGFLADRLGVLNVFIPILIANIILVYGWTGVHGVGAFYAWTVLFGLMAGALQSMFPTGIVSLSDDLSKTGTRLGMALSTIGFAALVGGPIGGALLQTDGGGYLPAQVWAGTSLLIGTCLVTAARVVKKGWDVKVKC